MRRVRRRQKAARRRDVTLGSRSSRSAPRVVALVSTGERDLKVGAHVRPRAPRGKIGRAGAALLGAVVTTALVVVGAAVLGGEGAPTGPLPGASAALAAELPAARPAPAALPAVPAAAAAPAAVPAPAGGTGGAATKTPSTTKA